MSPSILHPALAHVRALVFDLDGTLYESGAAIPGAADAVRALRDAGVPLRFLTNTTSRCRAKIVERMRAFGIAVEAGEVFSPPATAGDFLRAENARAHLVVDEATLPDFEGVVRDDDTPEYVVLGDLGSDWTWERLNTVFRLLHEGGAKLIGLGRTRYWKVADGLQLDVGPFVAALEYATGRRALVLGKPERVFFERVVASTGFEAAEVALVGDDVNTDVRAAKEAGLFGVLVKTGKYRPADLDSRAARPDLSIESAADCVVRVP